MEISTLSCAEASAGLESGSWSSVIAATIPSVALALTPVAMILPTDAGRGRRVRSLLRSSSVIVLVAFVLAFVVVVILVLVVVVIAGWGRLGNVGHGGHRGVRVTRRRPRNRGNSR